MNQVFDQETGLNQNWSREYDPRQGRYRQSDPIGLAGGHQHFCICVEGNPLSMVDKTGEAGVLVVVGGAEATGYFTYKMFSMWSPTPN